MTTPLNSPAIHNEVFQELIKRRYGESAPAVLHDFDDLNPALEVLFAHKSVRHYKNEALSAGTVEALAAAAQSASSSSNLQAWSLVAIQGEAHKDAAATLCGNQDFIRQAPLFFVFCADLARLTWVSQQEGFPTEGLDYLELFLIAALDAALAAQNVVLAAESFSLGICYVGAARNRPRELAALLKLPPRVIGIFGLSVGWPQENLTTTAKPRLPQPGLLHYETYNADEWESEVTAYNTTMQEFYEAQGLHNHQSWSQTVAKRVATKESLTGRHILKEILQERGFNLK